MGEKNTDNRWLIAAAGVLIQIALGAVYAWSVFRVPLAEQFGWSISQVTLTFTIAIFSLGFSSFFGGLWLARSGPRVVAMVGGVLYGLGVFLASFADHGLLWLYLSYGLIGGVGLGFCYIVPLAVLVKWFPDKRGLITGIAVGGFGAGALVTAPLATSLIEEFGRHLWLNADRLEFRKRIRTFAECPYARSDSHLPRSFVRDRRSVSGVHRAAAHGSAAEGDG